jgi:hypothetical protein
MAGGKRPADNETRFRMAMTDCEMAWRAGVSAAVVDAISWCRLFQRPPPVWLEYAVADIAKRQRTKAEAKRHYEAMVHYTRWDTMVQLCEWRKRLSWERRFEIASDLLAGTGAAGSPDTIAKSYKRVQRDFRAQRMAKYYVGTTRP